MTTLDEVSVAVQKSLAGYKKPLVLLKGVGKLARDHIQKEMASTQSGHEFTAEGIDGMVVKLLDAAQQAFPNGFYMANLDSESAPAPINERNVGRKDGVTLKVAIGFDKNDQTRILALKWCPTHEKDHDYGVHHSEATHDPGHRVTPESLSPPVPIGQKPRE